MNRAMIVKTNNASEHQLILFLFSKMGIRSLSIDDSILEDIGMSVALTQVDRNKKVTRRTVMKKLHQ